MGAKIIKIDEKVSSRSGLFYIIDEFNRLLAPSIDKTLGKRGKGRGYSYSEIFCPVSAAEEIADHREKYLAVLISDQLASSSEKLVYMWQYKTLKQVFHEEKTAKRGDFLKFCL